MTCPYCGVANDESADSCIRCGRGLYALTQGTLVGGRYEVQSLLGKGGMGVVYKATDRELDVTVALKVLRSDLGGSSDASKRFRSEIKLARKVSHRNVCRIHEYGREGHLSYIVMEFIEGVDLKRVIRDNGPFGAHEGIEVAIQVADALQAIHEVGIVHRDLKTPNIMRDEHGVVRLMDFGIAKSFDSPTADATATGHVIGTPEYMSPEQARSEGIDARSDIYSFGIVLFELLTGAVPFRGDTPVAILFKQIQAPPPLEGPAAARIPPPLVPILRQALAKDREERFGSARAVADALLQACPPSQPSAISTPTPRSRSRAAMALQLETAPKTLPVSTPLPTPVPGSLATEIVTVAAPIAGKKKRPEPGMHSATSRRSLQLGGAVVLAVVLVGGFAVWRFRTSSPEFDPRLQSGAGERVATGIGEIERTPPSSTTGRTSVTMASEPPPASLAQGASGATATRPGTARPNSSPPSEPAVVKPSSSNVPSAASVASSPPSAAPDREPTPHAPPPVAAVSSEVAPLATLPTATPSSSALPTRPSLEDADREAVLAALTAYAAALKQKDLEGVKRVWPTLGPAVERRLRDGFGFSQTMEVTLRPTRIRLLGDTAVAECSRHDEVVTADGQKVRNDTQATFTLRRGAKTWLIESIR